MVYRTLFEIWQRIARFAGATSINIAATWPNIPYANRTVDNDVSMEELTEDQPPGKGSIVFQHGANSAVSHRRTIIFVRHGQYNTSAKVREDKVLTELGWRQAYATGCRLKEMGIKIDYLVHSHLIRARQTTAAFLAGYHGIEDTSDDGSESIENGVFNLPVMVNLVSRELHSNSGDYSVETSSAATDYNPGANLAESQSVPTVTSFEDVSHSIGSHYKPFQSASFVCQQSRLLAEGSPPVHPEPPLARPRPEEQLQIDGARLNAGYETHMRIVQSIPNACTPPQTLTTTTTTICPTSNSRMSSFNALPPTVDARLDRRTTEDTVVFIGHANVFRYWLCRLLDLPPEAWLRFSIYHGSVTTLVLSYHDVGTPTRSKLSRESLFPQPTSRYVTVTATRVGEVGHLPVKWLTR